MGDGSVFGSPSAHLLMSHQEKGTAPERPETGRPDQRAGRRARPAERPDQRTPQPDATAARAGPTGAGGGEEKRRRGTPPYASPLKHVIVYISAQASRTHQLNRTECVMASKITPSPHSPGEDNEGKNPHAQALGRLGGLKGGKSRAAQLSAERRSEIARAAAQVRWERSKRER